MDLSGLVPTSQEMPFFSFTMELISVYKPVKADLAEAMEARANWRDASANTMPQALRKVADHAAMLKAHEAETRRMMAARPKANLRAAGILVTLQAIIEDVRQSVIGNMRDQFGPLINSVPFSHLLQAGANSCRHGGEWWRRGGAVWREPGFFSLTDAQQAKLINASWSKEQRYSIEVLAKALGVDQGHASNQPAVDVVWLLSDGGNARLMFDRMIATVVAIAKAKGRLADYNGAATMLGSPPAS
jgi:hypothetical protein